MKIGFIGIIGEELEADPEGTLSWIADLGLDGMEGAAAISDYLRIPVPEAKARLNDLGLTAAPQGRVEIDQSDIEWRKITRTAREIGAAYVVDYFAPFAGRDEIHRYCEYFNRVGRVCADEGLQFLYHNHDHEFRKFDDEYGLEIMFANTDPDLVKQELDVAWVTFGRKRYSPRSEREWWIRRGSSASRPKSESTGS